MITLSQFPEWLKGEFYHSLLSNEENIHCQMIRPLKTDLVFHTLKDVMELLDTCLYIRVEYLPQEVYKFASESPQLIQEIVELQFCKGPLIQYYEFTKTPEYKAIRICANEAFIKNKMQNKRHMTQLNMEERLLYEAILQKNLPLIVYCLNADRNCCNIYHLEIALSGGNLEIVKYMIENNPQWTPLLQRQSERCLLFVVENDDNVAILAYLHKKLEAKWTNKILYTALKNKCQQSIIYAIKTGYTITPRFVNIAIEYNMLKYLHFDTTMFAK